MFASFLLNFLTKCMRPMTFFFLYSFSGGSLCTGHTDFTRRDGSLPVFPSSPNDEMPEPDDSQGCVGGLFMRKKQSTPELESVLGDITEKYLNACKMNDKRVFSIEYLIGSIATIKVFTELIPKHVKSYSDRDVMNDMEKTLLFNRDTDFFKCHIIQYIPSFLTSAALSRICLLNHPKLSRWMNFYLKKNQTSFLKMVLTILYLRKENYEENFVDVLEKKLIHYLIFLLLNPNLHGNILYKDSWIDYTKNKDVKECLMPETTPVSNKQPSTSFFFPALELGFSNFIYLRHRNSYNLKSNIMRFVDHPPILFTFKCPMSFKDLSTHKFTIDSVQYGATSAVVCKKTGSRAHLIFMRIEYTRMGLQIRRYDLSAVQPENLLKPDDKVVAAMFTRIE